jgi:predicted ribosome quality control (RQC) complex YloA/Tae2 family protein
MDYLSLKAAVQEASRKIEGKRVTDAYQLSAREVRFLLAGGAELILSINPSRGGVFLPESASEPHHDKVHTSTNLTELLRARIKGSVLTSIKIPEPGERIVQLAFAPGWPDRSGDPVIVILEIMGRHSNLLILDKDRIVAALKTVSAGKSRTRPVITGEAYQPPPPLTGIPINRIGKDSLPDPSDSGAMQKLMDTVSGLSPHTASQALLAGRGRNKEALFDALERMDQESSGKNGYILRSGGKTYLTSFEPIRLEETDTVDLYEPFSRAALAWRYSETTGDEVKEPLDRDTHLLLSRKEQINKALKQLEREKERCRDFKEVRNMAELLLINAGIIEQGASSVTLPDPYGEDEPVTVPLDPKYTPQENANRLFSWARRQERGLKELESRGKKLGKDLDQLENALSAIKEKNDPEPARKILGNVDVKGKGGPGGPADQLYKGPGRRKVVDGFTILVGKSATDNDKVTFKAAGPNDLWLHARDYPGSHVVIITDKKQVPDNVLYAAASLAAEGSAAKNDTAPEIMVTERKWVKKLKGGKPGQVTVERFKSVRPRTRAPGVRSRGKKGQKND